MNAETHDRDHDKNLLAAYALDAVTAEERIAVEAQLDGCESCWSELRGYEATAGMLGAAVPADPPGALKERTLAAVRALAVPASDGAASDVIGALPRPRTVSPPSQQRRWPVPALAGLAASFLLLSVGLGVVTWTQQRQIDTVTATAQQWERVLTDPRLRTAEAPVAGGGEARVFVAGDRAVVAGAGLPALPDDRAYQLWVGSGETVRPAGLLGAEDTERATGFVQGVSEADALLLSVEPAGGSEQPTTTPVWRVDV